MTTERTRRTNRLDPRLQHQLAAIVRIEWMLWRTNWQEALRQNIAGLIISTLLVILPLSLALGGSLVVLPGQLVLNSLPTVFTIVFLLLLCMQALQAPARLWNAPDLEWFLITPVSSVLLLARPLISLLRASLLPVVVILLGASILVLFWHGSPALLLLLWLAGLEGAFLCPLTVLVGTLLLTWALGRARAQGAVVIAAVIMGLPALLMVLSFFAPAAISIQGAPLIHWLEEPARITLTTIWTLLTQPAFLTLAQLVLLIGAFLLLPLLLIWSYFWLGNYLFRRVWEGLRQEHNSPGSTAPPQLLWSLAWHLPGLTPAHMALIGYCWQDTLRNWADLPTVVVCLLIGLVTQGVPLFNAGDVPTYRDFLPLVSIPLILGENQFILLTIGKSLLRRLLQAQDVLRSTPVTATDIFHAATIALSIPAFVLWGSISLVAGLLLGMPLLPMLILMSMLALGLVACTPIALCASVFSLHAGQGSHFGVVLITWLLTLLITICSMVATFLLLSPIFRSGDYIVLDQLGIRMTAMSSLSFQSALLFIGCILISAGLSVFTGRIGIAGLHRKINNSQVVRL